MADQLALILIPLYLVLGYVAVTWIRARHGYPLSGRDRPSDAGADERAASIGRIEDRVRVLERIVTDRRAGLSAEIDALDND